MAPEPDLDLGPEPARVESDIIQTPVAAPPPSRASHVSKGGPGRSRNNNMVLNQLRQDQPMHETTGQWKSMSRNSPAGKDRDAKRPRDMSSSSESDRKARKKNPESNQKNKNASNDAKLRHHPEGNRDSGTASSARLATSNVMEVDSSSDELPTSFYPRHHGSTPRAPPHRNGSLVDVGPITYISDSDDTDDDSDGDIPAHIPRLMARGPILGGTPRTGGRLNHGKPVNQQRPAAKPAVTSESSDRNKAHARSREASSSVPTRTKTIPDDGSTAVSRMESRQGGAAGRLAAVPPPRQASARSGTENADSPLRSSETGSAQDAAAPSPAGDLATPLDPQSAAMWDFVRPHLVRTDKDEVPTKGYLRDFLKLAKVRELNWNKPWIARNPYVDAHPRDISSLIMQVTGDLAAQPCSKCQEGKGPYDGCVVISQQANPECQLMVVSCANCFYHSGQTYCSHQSMMKERFSTLFPHLDPEELGHQIMSAARFGKRKSKGPSSSTDRQPRQTSSSRRPREKSNPGTPAFDHFQSSRRSERLVMIESAAEQPEQPEQPTPVTETVVSNKSKTETTPEGNNDTKGDDDTKGDQNRGDPHPGGSSLISAGFMGSVGAETLEMEEWEVAPGRIRSNGGNSMENIAFSNSFVTAGRMVQIDEDISFRVEVVRTGSTFRFEKDTKATRICSVASGKLRVSIDGLEFVIGPNGMFKIKPGATCKVENKLYVDAYLHISAVWYA